MYACAHVHTHASPIQIPVLLSLLVCVLSSNKRAGRPDPLPAGKSGLYKLALEASVEREVEVIHMRPDTNASELLNEILDFVAYENHTKSYQTKGGTAGPKFGRRVFTRDNVREALVAGHMAPEKVDLCIDIWQQLSRVDR